MHLINSATPEPDVIYKLSLHAASGKFQNGADPMDQFYFDDCRWIFPTGMIAIFTRDIKLIEQGYWDHLGISNDETHPGHDQCMHLSLSFREPGTSFEEGKHVKKNVAETRKWVKNLFGRRAKDVWCEPPETPYGIEDDVWHYLLFIKPDLKTPQPLIEPVRRVLAKSNRLISWHDLEKVNHEVHLLDE